LRDYFSHQHKTTNKIKALCTFGLVVIRVIVDMTLKEKEASFLSHLHLLLRFLVSSSLADGRALFLSDFYPGIIRGSKRTH
jgi:hypothetical protein